jgi:hypothetical protein
MIIQVRGEQDDPIKKQRLVLPASARCLTDLVNVVLPKPIKCAVDGIPVVVGAVIDYHM